MGVKFWRHKLKVFGPFARFVYFYLPIFTLQLGLILNSILNTTVLLRKHTLKWIYTSSFRQSFTIWADLWNCLSQFFKFIVSKVKFLDRLKVLVMLSFWPYSSYSQATSNFKEHRIFFLKLKHHHISAFSIQHVDIFGPKKILSLRGHAPPSTQVSALL